MNFRHLGLMLGLSLIITTPVFAQSPSIASPVVQIVSYIDLYGNAVEMLGRGSASIIDAQGTIVTNNHVVDDGRGNVASAFSICVTRALDKQPDCSYTASLLDRDPERDIAVLRIDPKDIQGNPVSFSSFPVISIDYNYRPVAQDVSLAVGYPRIGAETLTQTKGSVAGSVEYNGFTYIKTDTLIAGGNSGGPLMVNGNMVGINTFTIGGFFDASLGYALLIADTQEFIAQAKTKPAQSSLIDIDFASYKSQLDLINKQKRLSDQVFDISFDSSYQIRNYQVNKQFQLVPRDNKRVQLQELKGFIIPTPTIKTSEDLAYHLQTLGIFQKENQKLTTVMIGGKSFLSPVWLYDVSEGDANRQQLYIHKLNNNHLIVLTAQGAFGDEQIGSKVKEELQNVLSKMNIIAPSNYQGAQSLTLKMPFIKISQKSGLLALDTQGFAQLYLRDSLHSSISLIVNPMSSYDGKGKTSEDLYKIITQDVNDELKKRIMFQGKEGFMMCSLSNGSNMGFASPFGRMFGGRGITANVDSLGRPLLLNSCAIYLFLSARSNNDQILVINLTTESYRITKDIDTMIAFLKKHLIIGQGKTSLPNILKQRVDLLYRDIDKQSDGWKEVLKKLVKYDLIQNDESLDPQSPMTWKTYANLYFRYLYNKDLSAVDVQKALQGMRVSRGDYVDSSKVLTFNELVRLRMAGVRLGDESIQGLQLRQQSYRNTSNTKLRQQLEQYEVSIYGDRKIGIYDIMGGTEAGYYMPLVRYQYVLGKGIIAVSNYETQAVSFDDKGGITPDQKVSLQQCARSTANLLTKNCLSLIREYAQSQLTYSILTKGEAIDILVGQMDFALFDTELAKKKTVRVEE